MKPWTRIGLLYAAMMLTIAVALVACKITIPVDNAGQPTGEPAMIEPSESGSMEAVTVAPDGTETPVELDASIDGEALVAAGTAAATALPPPWGMLLSLGIGLASTIRKK